MARPPSTSRFRLRARRWRGRRRPAPTGRGRAVPCRRRDPRRPRSWAGGPGRSRGAPGAPAAWSAPPGRASRSRRPARRGSAPGVPPARVGRAPRRSPPGRHRPGRRGRGPPSGWRAARTGPRRAAPRRAPARRDRPRRRRGPRRRIPGPRREGVDGARRRTLVRLQVDLEGGAGVERGGPAGERRRRGPGRGGGHRQGLAGGARRFRRRHLDRALHREDGLALRAAEPGAARPDLLVSDAELGGAGGADDDHCGTVGSFEITPRNP